MTFFSDFIKIFLTYVAFSKQLLVGQIKTTAFAPVVSFMLMQILFSNLVCMIPYAATITSQIALTLFFSVGSFTLINIMYLVKEKLNSIQLFLPAGTPLFITPFLIQI